MNIDLLIGGTSDRVTLSPSRFSARPACDGMQLEMPLEGRLPDDLAAGECLLYVSGTVEIDGKTIGPVAPVSRAVAVGSDFPIILSVMFTTSALTHIERLRKNEQLELQIRLGGHLLCTSSCWSLWGGPSNVVIGPGEWADLLQAGKYAQAMHFAIPLPSPSTAIPEGESAEIAIRRLQQVRHAMLRGDYERAIASVRAIIELLWGPEVKRAMNTGEDQSTTDQRFLGVAGALRKVTNLANHPEDQPPVAWTREDAVAVVAILGALMQRIGTGRPLR